jgi:uncharacterized protein (TIGR02246 family)
MKRTISLVICALIVTVAGCSQAPPPAPPDTREADATAIRNMETAAQADWAARDADKIAAFYADDASMLMPNMAILNGKDAIRNSLQAFVAGDPNFALSYSSDKVEVAKSGDYAYTQGTYTMKMTDPKTKKVLTENGKYVTVYEKQADGSWKAVADINNANAPASPAK